MKTFLHSILLSIAFIFTGVLSFNAQAQDSEEAILVLDGSGSMWGQIEGTSKIEIARDVLDGLLTELPESRRLGLMAYGHNRKGDCSDIELLAPVGASRTDISKAVKAINPKGKTPISASVKQAAEALNYTENKATVILISDGIETCNLDPCALGKQLEKDGIDFTTHVVGFDIVDEKAETQLQCLAESTGGRYLSASNAGELSIALGETVAQPDEEAMPAKLTLQATELPKGPVIESGLTWTVQQSGRGEIVIDAKEAGELTEDVPPGVYDVSVSRASDGLKGEERLVELKPNANKTVTIALKLDFEAKVIPDSEEVSAGSPFSVTWEGPDRKGDFINIANPDEDARNYIGYSYTSNGNPVKLTAPITAGEYEVRYVLGRPYRILAKAPLTVSGVAATISAPETAASNTAISVDWTGPATQSDFVTIAKKGAKAGSYMNYFYTKDKVSPKKLTVPLEPGEYEIRYMFVGSSGVKGKGRNEILASEPLTVTDVTASISAPETVIAGQSFSVEWEGQKSASTFLTIVSPDAKDSAYKSYAYTKDKFSPSKLTAPLEAGEYEVRFVLKGKKVLARQPITVTPETAMISAPKTAKVGEIVSVKWEGPKTSSTFVTITSPDARDSAYKSYAYTKNKTSPSKLTMPLQPGDYELRFVQSGKKVLARQAITVEDISMTIKAPKKAKVGETIEVTWDGPVVRGDWITVISPDAKDSKYKSYYYPINGSPGTVTVPKEPGAYEVRYVMRGKRVIARQPITVTE